jgi:hypothetical protein
VRGISILSLVVCFAFMSTAGAYADCCANWDEFAAYCRSQGGIPTPAGPGNPQPTCDAQPATAPAGATPSTNDAYAGAVDNIVTGLVRLLFNWMFGSPGSTGTNQLVEQVTSLNNAGVAAFQAGNYPRAVALFEQADAFMPNVPYIEKNLSNARAREKLSRLDKLNALADASAAAIDPRTITHPNLWYPPNSEAPPFPLAVVDVRQVSNGCGGGDISAKDRFIDTATFFETNNPLGRSYVVNFRAACNLHDAGYSGAAVRDEINGGFVDYFGWTKEQVDAKFLADLRQLCEAQIPPSAPGALSDCKNNGGKISGGAATYYSAVDTFGHLFWERRPNLTGTWTATSGSGSSIWQVDQTGRSVTARWSAIGPSAVTGGVFEGTVITQDRVTVIKGTMTESSAGSKASRPASITIWKSDPDRATTSDIVLSKEQRQ